MMEKIVILDRDGVINCEQPKRYDHAGDELKGYILSPDQFIFLPRALDAIKLLTEKRFRIHVLSNQSAVGRGLISRETLDEITEKMMTEVRQHGGNIESVQYCTHVPESLCRCRKPRPGMFIDLAGLYKIDFGETWFVGDKLTDMEPANSLGCRTILVESGLEKHNPSDKVKVTQRLDFYAVDLWEAVNEVIFKNP